MTIFTVSKTGLCSANKYTGSPNTFCCKQRRARYILVFWQNQHSCWQEKAFAMSIQVKSWLSMKQLWNLRPPFWKNSPTRHILVCLYHTGFIHVLSFKNSSLFKMIKNYNSSFVYALYFTSFIFTLYSFYYSNESVNVKLNIPLYKTMQETYITWKNIVQMAI